jgi:hypothetical protein
MAQAGSTGLFRVGGLLMRNGIMHFSGSAAPSNGVNGTGAGKAGPGSVYTRTTGAVYVNTNTKASPTWTQLGTVAALADGRIFVGNAGGAAAAVVPSGDLTMDNTGKFTLAGAVTKYDEVTISAADIIAVGAGKFGHAQGYPLVAGPGAGKVLEFLEAVLIYDQGVKAYTGGGDTTVNWESGGAALSTKVANSEFCAHNGDTVNLVKALNPATGISLPVNTGINLVTTVAFADGGVGAVGVVRVKVAYRVHTTGL